MENGLKYLARSALDFLERDRPSFVLGDRNKTVFVGRNMPDHLVLLIKNGSFLIDQQIETQLAPQVSKTARISWQVCSYVSTSFLLLHYPDERIVYIDLVSSDVVEDVIDFAITENRYIDLSVAR